MKRSRKAILILAVPLGVGFAWWAIQYQTIPREASTEVSLPELANSQVPQQSTWLSLQGDCTLQCFQEEINQWQKRNGKNLSAEQLKRVFTSADADKNKRLSPDESATIGTPSQWGQKQFLWSFVANKNYSRDEFVSIVQGYERYHGHQVSTEGAIHTKFDAIQKRNRQTKITGEIPGKWLNQTATPLKW